MQKGVRIDLLNHCLHFVDHLVNAWLQVSVIVLNVIYEFGQTPKSISLSREKLLNRQTTNIVQGQLQVLRAMIGRFLSVSGRYELLVLLRLLHEVIGRFTCLSDLNGSC